MKKCTVWLVLITLGATTTTTLAQRRRMAPTSKYSMASAHYAATQYLTFGGAVGATNYFGDIAPSSSVFSTDLRFTRLSLTGYAMYRFRRRWSGRLSASFNRLQGDDFAASTTDSDAKYRFARNLHFRNDVKELDAVAVYDWYRSEDPRKNRAVKRSQWVSYLFGGVGVMLHNPVTRQSPGGSWVSLQPLGTEGQGLPGYDRRYSRVQLVIPAGVGLRWRLNDRFDLAVEVGYRYTFTDYLDDVSGRYANPDVLSPLARRLADRTQEPVGAYSGQSREPGLRAFRDSVDPFAPLAGFGQAGDQRGNPAPDAYLITNFHVNYVIAPFGKRSRNRP